MPKPFPYPHRTKTRLFVDAPLHNNAQVQLTEDRAHYLIHVLRMKESEAVGVFNGRDGEWLAKLSSTGKRAAVLTVQEKMREQDGVPDIWLLFALLKRARTDSVIEKATELGAAKIVPVITAFTNAEHVNLERLKSIAVEAAEQSERLSVPEITPPVDLTDVMASWDPKRSLLVCAESGDASPIVSATAAAPAAILIGPEGGFSQDELAYLRGKPFARFISLGPRILRADTAATAMLACWQGMSGDWR